MLYKTKLQSSASGLWFGSLGSRTNWVIIIYLSVKLSLRWPSSKPWQFKPLTTGERLCHLLKGFWAAVAVTEVGWER